MRREGKHPLSKVPHLGDPELDNYVPNKSAGNVEAPTVGSDKSTGVCVDTVVEAEARVEGGAKVEVEAGARSDTTGEDSVAADQIAYSSVPLVPVPAPAPIVDDKSSFGVIATARDKQIIESEAVVGGAGALTDKNGNSIAITSITPGIEEEISAKVDIEIGVEVQGGTETDKEYLVRTCRYDSTHCTILHCTSLHDTRPHYTALHYTTLHYTTLHYNALHH